MKSSSLLTATLVLAGSLAFAYTPNLENGKALFESPSLGGGTTGKSCKSCHPGGKRLGADLFDRKEESLAATINVCIQKPLGGKAIDPKGEEMQDLLAYIRTLVTKQNQKALGGC